jgi:hypothetical protein
MTQESLIALPLFRVLNDGQDNRKCLTAKGLCILSAPKIGQIGQHFCAILTNHAELSVDSRLNIRVFCLADKNVRPPLGEASENLDAFGDLLVGRGIADTKMGILFAEDIAGDDEHLV